MHFLGFVCKFVREAFVIPQDKRNKFVTWEDIPSSHFVSLKTPQRFSGRLISILGSKLYVREVFKAISCLSGSFQLTVKLEAYLQAESE